MTSDNLKIAKLYAKTERDKNNIELARAMLSNPVFELLLGVIAISYLNKGSQSWLESATGIDLAAGGEYAGLIAIIGLQQIAPLVPAIVSGSGPAAAAIGKLLPAVAAL